MMQLLTDPQAWMAFITLTALELVLGIDNIIFISILVEKLPKERREFARRLGLFLAMFMRIALLLTLAWIAGMTDPIFHIGDHPVSGRDVILFAGGLFLLWKSTQEIHQLLEGTEGHASRTVKASFFAIITAVGMSNQIPVMIAAVVVSVGLMMAFAGLIGSFIEDHPTIKMLALGFLLVVGVVLMADGAGHHVPKGYIYFAMAFSVAIEALNIRLQKNLQKPVDLREPYSADTNSQDSHTTHS
jgi:predicted tellurium resistance membrane protein TerC